MMTKRCPGYNTNEHTPVILHNFWTHFTRHPLRAPRVITSNYVLFIQSCHAQLSLLAGDAHLLDCLPRLSNCLTSHLHHIPIRAASTENINMNKAEVLREALTLLPICTISTGPQCVLQASFRHTCLKHKLILSPNPHSHPTPLFKGLQGLLLATKAKLKLSGVVHKDPK